MFRAPIKQVALAIAARMVSQRIRSAPANEVGRSSLKGTADITKNAPSDSAPNTGMASAKRFTSSREGSHGQEAGGLKVHSADLPRHMFCVAVGRHAAARPPHPVNAFQRGGGRA